MNLKRALCFPAAGLLLAASLLLVGCTVSQVVTDLNEASTGIDDGLLIASALGAVPPAIAADFVAGETCIQTAIPVLEAGGNVGGIAQTVLQDCGTAAAPVIPAGTDSKLAAKVESVGQAIAKVLQSFNVTITPAAPATAPGTAAPAARAMTAKVPVTTATWTPTSGDKAALKKLAAHKYKPLPAATARLDVQDVLLLAAFVGVDGVHSMFADNAYCDQGGCLRLESELCRKGILVSDDAPIACIEPDAEGYLWEWRDLPRPKKAVVPSGPMVLAER